MMPSRRSSTSLRVCMNHQVIHTIQDYPALASRANYFIAIDDLMPDGTNYLEIGGSGQQEHEHRVVSLNDNSNDEPILQKIPKCIPPSTVAAFLKALEHDSFGTDFWATPNNNQKKKNASNNNNPQVERRFAFYALWLFFGCHKDLLSEFVDSLTLSQRIELLQYAASISHKNHNTSAASRNKNNNAAPASATSVSPLVSLTPLLDHPNFWESATQLDIPLDGALCTLDLKTALALLKAHAAANPHDWLSPVKQAGFLFQNVRHSARNKNKNSARQQGNRANNGDNETTMVQRLSPQAYAVVLLQTHAKNANSSLWNAEHLNLVFHYISNTDVLPKVNGQPPVKPKGLEALVSQALLLHEEITTIPKLIREWEGLDEALIAPTLWNTRQVSQAVLYPRPQRILQTVFDGWTAKECAAAFQEDSDLGALLDWLDGRYPQGCAWLAELPVIVGARQELHGMVQAVLYRLLFLHVSFDATLPPELLGTLPMTSTTASAPAEEESAHTRYAVWALDHATRYLEAGIDSEVFCKLLWNTHANGILLSRVVKALHQMEQQQEVGTVADPALPLNAVPEQVGPRHSRTLSPLWKCIDLDKLSVDDLEYVPPRLLAVYAVRGQRQDQTHVQELNDTVMALQTQLQHLTESLNTFQQDTAKREKTQTQKVHKLERHVKQLQTETKQLKRENDRLLKRETAMKKMMETKTGQHVVG